MISNLLKSTKILITGGTGSFGKAFLKEVLSKKNFERIVIYSRDELKQWELQQLYSESKYPNLRFVGLNVSPKQGELATRQSIEKGVSNRVRFKLYDGYKI